MSFEREEQTDSGKVSSAQNTERLVDPPIWFEIQPKLTALVRQKVTNKYIGLE